MKESHDGHQDPAYSTSATVRCQYAIEQIKANTRVAYNPSLLAMLSIQCISDHPFYSDTGLFFDLNKTMYTDLL